MTLWLALTSHSPARKSSSNWSRGLEKKALFSLLLCHTLYLTERYSKKVFSGFYSNICNGGDLFNCYSWDNNLPSCDYLTFIWALFSKIFTQWDFTSQEKKLDGVSDYLGLTSFQHFPENVKKNLCHSCSSWRFEANTKGAKFTLQNSLVFFPWIFGY